MKIIDCTSFKIFEGATVYNAITIFSKVNTSEHIEYKITQNADDFQQLIKNENEKITIEKILKNNQNWCLVFKLDKNVLDLVLKIRENSNKLLDYFPEFSQGLIAYDKYQGQSQETIKNRVFHYNNKEKDSLKKWLWGSDVTRYSINWNGEEWLDYCDGIANPRNPKFFNGERLLIREITNPSIFCGFTTDELYHDPANIVILKGNKYDLKVLLAIMNSKVATFYHFNSSPKATKGAFPKILVEDIKNFPIPIIPIETERLLIEITDKIINYKNCIPVIETLELEYKIDKIVYALYGLNDEEIIIIEQ